MNDLSIGGGLAGWADAGSKAAAIVALIYHPWESEWRAGVEHYAVGQHVAIAVTVHPDDLEPWDRPDALVAFVPASGHGVTIVPCLHVEGIWCPLSHCIRILCALNGGQKLPFMFTLSDAMLNALEKALLPDNKQTSGDVTPEGRMPVDPYAST
jgi:hypothetical protein